MAEKPTYEELEKQIQGLNSTTVELERVKRRIKAKEEFNNSLLNNSPHPIIVINPDTSVRYVNPALEKLTGYSTEEILGTTTPYIWWTESTQKKTHQDFDKALQTGAKRIEELFIKKNGEQFWVEITSMPTIVNGKINYYLANWVDITERKRVEASLLESEERFKTLSTLTFEGIFTHNNGVIVDSNRAVTKILGYTREELIGENIIQICVPQEYHATIKENIVKSFAKPYEVMARRKDGTLFPAEIEAKDIKKNNKIFRVSAIRDITERKKVEGLLEQLLETFELAQKMAKIGHWRYNIETQQPTWSEQMFMVLGCDPDNGVPNYEAHKKIFHPDDWEMFDKAVQGSINGIPYNIEARLIFSDGSIHWCNAQGFPHYDQDGNVVELFGTTQDITERKKTEKDLQESEKKYRSMMESMKDAAYICSPDLRIEYMNPTMIDRVGRDATGEICHKAIYDRDEKCSWCVFDQVEQKEHVEYEVADPKDNRYYSVINSPIFHTAGTVSKLTIFHDITEIKDIEAQLRQSRKMESIGTLAGGIAHDFNNLLYMISGNAELALEDIPKWNPVHTNLEEIKSASLRAAGIVKQLLNFSRKTDKGMKPIGAVTVIKDALKFLRSTIPTTIEIHNQLPDTEVPILGDPIQINQIMMNLCTNASQAMEETGGILEINVDTLTLDENAAVSYPDLSAGDYLKITVSDTGPGIAQEIIEQIFDPYFTTKEMGKGSGMGLSIVHGIVKNHDGAITVDSKIGKDTTFTILFPVVGEKPVEDIAATGELLLGTESILFVDDEESITNMTGQMLERLGYQVQTSLNPIEALALFKSKPESFNLVITDMTMPEMTGARLSEKLIKIRSDLPVIICTGHSSLIDEDKARQLGIAGYVMKPASMSRIAKAIREVLDK